MPWCDGCDRYLNPNTVHDDGTCPSCGATLASPRQIRRARAGHGSSADARAVRAGAHDDTSAAPRPDGAGRPDGGDAAPGAPWHFWVLLVALVLYLGYRVWEGVLWLGQHL